MPRTYLNNFDSTIAAAITTTIQTSVTLQTGLGAQFTAAGVDPVNPIRLALVNGSTIEEIEATAVSGDVLTVRRGVNGTTAATFPSGAAIGCYATAESFSDNVPPNAHCRTGFWKPGNTTAITQAGMVATTATTISHPGPAFSVTYAEACERARYTSAATANTATGIRDTRAHLARGNAAGRGGFDVMFRYHSGQTANSTCQVHVGLGAAGALAGEPSAIVDVLAFIKDSTDTNFFFARRTASGAVTKVDLNVAYAVNLTFDVRISCNPNGAGFRCRVWQLGTDGTPTQLLDTVYTTAIPANTTLLARSVQARTTTAAACIIEHGDCPYLATQ